MARSIPILCALLFTVGSAAAQIDADRMSRQAKEAFLKKASVVSIKEVGEGVTRPLKVVLDDGTTRMKAIFKNVDLRMKTPTKFGTETVDEYTDSYKYEIAAYELDKLIGLNMLPVTVERKIEGKRGSLMEWIEDVMPHYGHGNPPPDMAKVRDQVQTFWLFDYLIYNVDRHVQNVMIRSGWVPALIDHSMTFTTFERPFRPLYRFPREIIDRLRALDKRPVKKALGRYIKRHQLEALMRRREIILEMVDREVAERGEGEVFFSLEDVSG